MPKVRGSVLLSTVRYVKERFGPEAHDRVMAALPERHRATFLGPVREASWEPLVDVSAYMETARKLLAPDDEDFHHELGVYAGRRARTGGGVAPMVADPATAMRLGPVIWKSFCDAGRFEFLVQGKREGFVRIHHFPTTRALCQRFQGSWESLLGSDALPARMRKTACVLDGDPYCEFHVVWGS